MKTRNFFEYLPKRYAERTIVDAQVRNLIFSFKDGERKAIEYAAKRVAFFMYHCYQLKCNEYQIVCVPARSEKTYRKRFALFTKIVCRMCRQEDAMAHVHIIGEREALHNSYDHVVREENYHVSVDADFFAGRKVIIFDDLITSGNTANNFAAILQAAGAEVVGGLFLAQTIKGQLLKSKEGRRMQFETDLQKGQLSMDYFSKRDKERKQEQNQRQQSQPATEVTNVTAPTEVTNVTSKKRATKSTKAASKTTKKTTKAKKGGHNESK